MESQILHLTINNWTPFKYEERILREFLEPGLWGDNSEEEPWEVLDKKLKDNKICIRTEIWDQSLTYFITCTQDWLSENYPELLPHIDICGLSGYYLDYTENNYGIH